MFFPILFHLKIARCVLSKKGLIVRDCVDAHYPRTAIALQTIPFQHTFSRKKKLEKVLEYLLTIDNSWSQNKTMDVKLSAFRRTFQKEINKPTYYET